MQRLLCDASSRVLDAARKVWIHGDASRSLCCRLRLRGLRRSRSGSQRHVDAACASSPGDLQGQTEGPSSSGSGPSPMPQPQLAGQAGYAVIVPPKIMVTITAGLKYHAITCSEVAPERHRIIKTLHCTPCSKCEAVLKVPIGLDRKNVHG